MANPRFTVLIPTRDRCETLQSTIATCLAQDYDNLRVIVSDNVSTDATGDVVASFDDGRLAMVQPDRRLSMTANFEFALSQVSEGFVMHLGDDDGLLPDGVAVAAAIARETGCEAVTSSHAVFHWPNSLFESRRNILTLQVAKGYEIRNARQYNQRVASYELNYPNLPGTYVSFVDMAVIQRAKRSGKYYRSITPDCYSGFLNAAHLDRYAYSKRPFAVSGISGRSNGASQIIATDPKEADKYKAENDIQVHPSVVYCPRSVEIVVAEAFLQAREQAGGLLDVDFDLRHLCHVALRDASETNYAIVREAVEQISQINGLGVIAPERKSTLMTIQAWLLKNRTRLERLSQGYRRIDCAPLGAKTIYDACCIAANRLDRT